MAKLTNLNGRHIAALPDAEFAERTAEFAEATGRNRVLEWRAADPAGFAKAASLAKGRTKLLSEVDSWRCFFEDVEEFDAESAERILKPESVAALRKLASALSPMESADPAEIESALRSVEKECGLDEGKLNRPARFAATGLGSGPDLDATLALIGTKRAADNIERALERFQN
jgi:nondiscriminating glutamyl-tRNA synthetase